MASVPARALAVAIFGAGIWAVLNVPALGAYFFGIGGSVSGSQLELALEIYGFAAVAATAGFAAFRHARVLHALCAVPLASLFVWLVPTRVGFWVSESFRSVTVNVVFV